jgi:hypothetical protein
MTPAEGLRKQIEIYRDMSCQERLAIGFQLHELARVLVRQGIKHQHPEWDEERVEQELVRRFVLARDGVR